MSKPQGNKPQRRAFHCSHCHAEILIPADLPPTSGPCPHCQKLVTSPAPKGAEPVPGKRSNDTPKRLTTKAQPAARLFAHESSPEARAQALKRLEAAQAAPPEPPRMNAAERKTKPNKPVVARRTKQADKAGGETRSEFEKMIDEEVRNVGRVFRRTIAALLLVAIGVALFLHFRNGSWKSTGGSTPQSVPDNSHPPLTAEYIAGGWIRDARRVLRSYLNAQTAFGKAEHILGGEQLLDDLKHFQSLGMLYDLDTPEEFFEAVSLDEQDRARGIFLMAHRLSPESYTPVQDVPYPDGSPLVDPEAARSTPTRIFAFFKHTDQGLKLDWEVFAQTKHRRLRQFATNPKFGETRVFRVLIAQARENPEAGQAAATTYLVSDPANLSDTIRAICLGNAPAAEDLAELNWVGNPDRKPVTRTATLELSWGGDPDQPRLLITKFLCWEFLGLGGN